MRFIMYYRPCFKDPKKKVASNAIVVLLYSMIVAYHMGLNFTQPD